MENTEIMRYNWDKDAEKKQSKVDVSVEKTRVTAHFACLLLIAVGSCVLKEFTSVPDPVRKARMVIVTS